MQFPTRVEIRKALLLALADGAPHYSDDVEVAVGDILGLSAGQRRAPAGNTRGTRLGNEIDWVKGAGDTGVGLFERVRPKFYRLTPYGQSAAAGKIDLDHVTRTIRSRVSSPPSDLEQLLDKDAETLRQDQTTSRRSSALDAGIKNMGRQRERSKRSNVSSRSIRGTRSLQGGSASCDGN